MRIIKYIFEGTSDEFLKVADKLGQDHVQTSLASEVSERGSGDRLSVENLRRVLRYQVLSDGILSVFKVLYEAGDKGVTHKQLLHRLNLTGQQLGGTLGGFGVRLNAVFGEGAAAVHGDIIETRNSDVGWVYTLTGNMRKALELEQICQF